MTDDNYDTEKDLNELGIGGLNTEALQQILAVARYHQILCKVKLTDYSGLVGTDVHDRTRARELKWELSMASEVVNGLKKMLYKKHDAFLRSVREERMIRGTGFFSPPTSVCMSKSEIAEMREREKNEAEAKAKAKAGTHGQMFSRKFPKAKAKPKEKSETKTKKVPKVGGGFPSIEIVEEE